MDAFVVEVVRGEVVEARHRVHAVAVSGDEVVASAGDAGHVTFFRSAAKPIQVLPLVRVRPDLDDAEIAIACASHTGAPDRVDAVRRLLAKAGASRDDLECAPPPGQLEHVCSGKHAAMLLLCRERGWPIDGYRLPDHPCQQALLAEVAAASGVGAGSLSTGIDGCGVVTYGLSIERMASAFARLETLEGGHRVSAAMKARPELVGTDAWPDVALMRGRSGWVAKYGAEGLLCAAHDGLGIALKVEDGAPRALVPALAAFLERLGFEAGSLADASVVNARGEVVGDVRVAG